MLMFFLCFIDNFISSKRDYQFYW